MPKLAEIESFLLTLPEVNVLLTCARRQRIRFALAGGIVRNILLRFDDASGAGTSLYDFIDPFSDIDIVVENEADWMPLREAILGSVPYAGFYRWEPRPLAVVQGAANQYEMIPIDRFLLWIDG